MKGFPSPRTATVTLRRGSDVLDFTIAAPPVGDLDLLRLRLTELVKDEEELSLLMAWASLGLYYRQDIEARWTPEDDPREFAQAVRDEARAANLSDQEAMQLMTEIRTFTSPAMKAIEDAAGNSLAPKGA